ncbi:MAG: methyltransferase domain-containing protein [Planctomycetes bacterium]|nr:methyltransferase domain-containing protein [Planctomycetota bacterium]
MEAEVLDRYTRGAQDVEPGLCCPDPGYDRTFLENVPAEIAEKDYGCGNPSRHVREGEIVLDLGSGSGKICYILAQKVGPSGRILGLDFNDAMLALARKYLDELARKIGYRNLKFAKARIQDLALDLERVKSFLEKQPISSLEQLSTFERECERMRREEPLVPDGTVDLVVSNCVLNLVRREDRRKLFSEIYRVLKRGGRAIISDIVCDEDPTPEIQADPKLWSGCIAGAFREDRFIARFEEAGFHGVELLSRADRPWQVIDGIEFRSMTVRAFKGKEGPCLDRLQAVIYKGPWKQVCDDDGHTLFRSQRMAVCDKTFRLLTDPSGPYASEIIPIEPYDPVPLDEAGPFECKGAALRPPREIKGQDRATRLSAGPSCCSGGSSC